MKKKLTNLALVMCLSPFLLQCVAAQKDVRGLDLRTRAIDTRLVTLERDVEALKNKSGGQAEMGEEINRLRARLLQVEGRLDERTHSSRAAREKIRKLKQDLRARYDTLEKHLAEQGRRVDALRAETEKLNKLLAQVSEQLYQNAAGISEIKQARAREAAARAEAAAKAAREAQRESAHRRPPATREIIPVKTKKKVTRPRGKSAPQPGKSAAVKQSKPPKTVTVPGKDLYDQGLADFRAKRYKQAYTAFSDYLDKFPEGGMAPNARFWRGDCLYHQKEYELAILEYQKVIADFPSHPKAPAGLLKQGLAFEKLKEKDTAKIVYQKLLDDYPKSDQAATARKRLRNLQ